MDSGNIAETQNETAQPDLVVVTETEKIDATPQADATEQNEFYVDVEGDQSNEPNSNMSEQQTRAAWKEEKRKRKERTEEANKERERADKLERRLEEMESKVNQATRPQRPDPLDFDSNEDFDKAYDDWRNHGKTERKSTQQQQEQGFQMSEDQEYHLHQSETNLKKSFKDYDDIKKRVGENLQASLGGDKTIVMNALSAIAHTFDVDPAKAFLALDKMPGKIEELKKNSNNQAQLGKILRDLEKAVKVRERKSIDSKPEPKIDGGGPVDMTAKQLEDAKKAYYAEPSKSNHAKLQSLRKQIKANNQAKVNANG